MPVRPILDRWSDSPAARTTRMSHPPHQRCRRQRELSAVANALPLLGSGELLAGDLLVCTRRQIDRNLCPLSDLAVCRHRAAGLLRKTINLRQTEPSSFTDLFGCEEWIEHPGQKIWRNTSARIAKRYREKGFPRAIVITSFLIYGHGVDG